MRKVPLRSVLLIVVGLAVAASLWQAGQEASGRSARPKPKAMVWAPSLNAALQTAAREKKIVFADFYATWCGPCQMMLQQTYTDPAVIERSADFVSVQVDVDKEPDLAVKYNAQALPTLVFLDAQGNVLLRDAGFHDALEFAALLDAVQRDTR